MVGLDGFSPALREYKDTLRRVMGGGFADLTVEERRVRIAQVIQLSAQASVLVGAAPVPFLEIPVQVLMVQAIASIHGHKGSRRGLYARLVAALGGSVFLRQVGRLIPYVGNLSHISRVYAGTIALGRVADLYFERGAQQAKKDDLGRVFEETLHNQTADYEARATQKDIASRLNQLATLHRAGHISEDEFKSRRREILEEI